MTDKDIIAIYSPDKPYKVYERQGWLGDTWDALDYGRDFDFSRPFFDQFAELLSQVPLPSREVGVNENSDHTNQSGSLKNCYLCFEAGYCQDCRYCGNVFFSSNISDCLYVVKCEICHECSDVAECYELYYSRECERCRFSAFLRDCADCEYCLECSGLRGRKYYYRNEPCNPETFVRLYEETLRRWAPSSPLPDVPVPCAKIVGSESASGDHVYSSARVHHSFDMNAVEDVRHSSVLYVSRSCMDFYSFGDNSELVYEAMAVGTNAQGITFSWCCNGDVAKLLYCADCLDGVSDCFACVGLRHKQYCILNKQYTEEEYNTLVPKIISHMRETGEWGEFFAPSISPFGYNETVAMEYYPLTKEQAIAQWFNWSDYEPPFPAVSKIIPANKLPENIKDIPDDILAWAIECEVTRKPYRIIKQELEFYRKHSLPIPRRHPDQRHLDRLSLRNPRKLHERKCDSCSKAITTTYAPDRPERVYCEECYHREIYG